MNLSNVSTLFEEVIDMVPASCKNLNYLENLLQSNNIFVVNNEEANNGSKLNHPKLLNQFLTFSIFVYFDENIDLAVYLGQNRN